MGSFLIANGRKSLFVRGENSWIEIGSKNSPRMSDPNRNKDQGKWHENFGSTRKPKAEEIHSDGTAEGDFGLLMRLKSLFISD